MKAPLDPIAGGAAGVAGVAASTAASAPSITAPATGARPTARVAVLGASGYSGQEFARLALAHPGLVLAVFASREHAGRPATELLPGLDPRAVEIGRASCRERV